MAMAIYAIKHKDESNDRLQQRFKKQVQKSGMMKLLRERHTYRKPLTRRLQRLRALKREQYRARNRQKQFYSNM
jgi:ribosomal protein S21